MAVAWGDRQQPRSATLQCGAGGACWAAASSRFAFWCHGTSAWAPGRENTPGRARGARELSGCEHPGGISRVGGSQ